METDWRCESRVKNQGNEGRGNAVKDVKKKARKRADQRGRLDIGQAVEPVEKTLNGLTDRTDKRREHVTGNQDVTLELLTKLVF